LKIYDQKLVRFLLWSGGMENGEFDAEVLLEPESLELLSQHRVIGRFLDRMEALDPLRPLSSRSDLTGFINRHEQHSANADLVESDALDLVRTMSESEHWDGRPVILLKGNSANYHIASGRTRRRTGDLDLLPADPERFQAILESLGYEKIAGNWCHEHAKLGRAHHAGIDLHRYFPVWRYPGETYMESESNGQILRMSDWVRSEHLEYDAILDMSVPLPGDLTGFLRIPDVTMTAFILVLHVFKDFVAPPLTYSVAKVRLFELCEIRDLLAHPSFSAASFEVLMQRYRAEDAVAFVGRLYEEAGTAPMLLPRPQGAGLGSFPQEIGYGLLVDARTPLRDMLARTDGFGRTFDVLGAADIDLGSRTRVSTRERANPAGFKVFKSSTEDPSDGTFDFDCDIWLDDTTVVFSMEVLRPAGVFFDEFVLFFGNEEVHTAHLGHKGGVLSVPPPASGSTAEWTVGADAWSVQVRVPLAQFERHRGENGSVLALLHGGTFKELPGERWDDLYRRSISSAVVPLRLNMAGSIPETEGSGSLLAQETVFKSHDPASNSTRVAPVRPAGPHQQPVGGKAQHRSRSETTSHSDPHPRRNRISRRHHRLHTTFSLPLRGLGTQSHRMDSLPPTTG
jgi:hypothetical protein